MTIISKKASPPESTIQFELSDFRLTMIDSARASLSAVASNYD